jgi:tetratricopeptide (TPR) repeat protein
MRLLALTFLLLPGLAAAELADAVARLDELHGRRHAAIEELKSATQQALEAHGGEYEVLWRASRLEHWIADDLQGEAKKRHGQRGWELGEQAAKLKPSRPEGSYFGAIGLGAYSQAVGIVKAITAGLEGKYNKLLDTSIQLDPWFDNGGPLLAKGRYFHELPWPKRDLKKAAEHFRRVLEKKPNNLRARYYLADTLLRDGKAKEAAEVLAPVPGGDEAYDPAEAKRVKRWAKPLQAEIDKALK